MIQIWAGKWEERPPFHLTVFDSITAVLSFTRSSNIRNWEKRGLVQGLESFVMFDYDYLYSLVKCKQHGSTPSSQ
jgi:hypothetical protein